MPGHKLFQTPEEKAELCAFFRIKYKSDLEGNLSPERWESIKEVYNGNIHARVAEKLIALALLETLATHPDYRAFHIVPIVRGTELEKHIQKSNLQSAKKLICHTIPLVEHMIWHGENVTPPAQYVSTNEISGFEGIIIIDPKRSGYCLFDFGFGGCELKHFPQNFVRKYSEDASFYSHDSLLLTQKVLKDTNDAIVKSLAKKKIETERIVSLTDVKAKQITIDSVDDETTSLATMSLNSAVQSLTATSSNEGTQYTDPMPTIKFLGLDKLRVRVHSKMDNGLLKLGILPLFDFGFDTITFGISQATRDTLIPHLDAGLSSERLGSYINIARGQSNTEYDETADMAILRQKPGPVTPPFRPLTQPIYGGAPVSAGAFDLGGVPPLNMFGLKKPQQLMPQTPYIPFNPAPAAPVSQATPGFFQTTPQQSQPALQTQSPLGKSVTTIETTKQHPVDTASSFDVESDLGFMSLRQPTQTFWQKTAEKRKVLGTQSLGGSNLGGSMLPELETPEARKARLEKKNNPQASSSNTPGM
ncbi:MAG: hypothetical protein P4L79_01920 [Legionella sp.]|uniref:hypothetical protein n=1 Tax=Legionella sp. TaxID=459 RepID=UPI00283F726B|nr:hypothetical protein [Legionella sp.]